ncbi:MAG: hypothetical protein AB8B50_06435 [Pirellulaceae bacterium]
MQDRSVSLRWFVLAASTLNFYCEASRAQSDDANASPKSTVSELPRLGPGDFPEVENGWYRMPPWAEDLPFDIEAKFAIPPNQNREQSYCQIFAEWNISLGYRLFPAFHAMEETDISRLRDAQLAHSREVIDFVFDREGAQGRFEPLQTDSDFETARRLLTPYRAGLERLKRIGQRHHSFFHSEWLPSSGSRVYDGRDFTYILALKCNSELASPEALLWVELALQLKRDLVSLGDQIEQLAGASLERTVFDSMVVPILQRSDLTLAEIDRLIGILREHDKACAASDPCLAATEREILELRHVIHLLATSNLNTEERRKRLGLDPDTHLITALLREVVDYGFYRINSAYVRQEVERLAQSNDVIRNAWKQAEANWDEGDGAAEGARILLGFFLSGSFDSITAQSLEPDIAVLNTRHRQIKEACKLPYPESTVRLSELQGSWTLDGAWQQTAFLRWFLPLDRVATTRRSAQTCRNAYLTLAAVRRWQLQHNGQDPSTLKLVFGEIGVSKVPVDPYSGKPLKLFSNSKSIGTYSIGPDGKDDRAEVIYDPLHSPIGTPANGDLLFVIKRQ